MCLNYALCPPLIVPRIPDSFILVYVTRYDFQLIILIVTLKEYILLLKNRIDINTLNL